MTLLQFFGFRSLCCNAKFLYKYGWDYREDGKVCSRCGLKANQK